LKGFSVDQCPVIAHNKQNNGLDDWNTVSKFGSETGQEIPNDPDGRSTKDQNNKRGESGKNVHRLFDQLQEWRKGHSTCYTKPVMKF